MTALSSYFPLAIPTPVGQAIRAPSRFPPPTAAADSPSHPSRSHRPPPPPRPRTAAPARFPNTAPHPSADRETAIPPEPPSRVFLKSRTRPATSASSCDPPIQFAAPSPPLPHAPPPPQNALTPSTADATPLFLANTPPSPRAPPPTHSTKTTRGSAPTPAASCRTPCLRKVQRIASRQVQTREQGWNRTIHGGRLPQKVRRKLGYQIVD